MNAHVLSRTWKVLIVILLLNCLVLVGGASVGTYKAMKSMDMLDVAIMTRVKVDSIQKMVEYILEDTVEVLNVIRNFNGEDDIFIRYVEASDMDLERSVLLDSRLSGDAQIELYYKNTTVGKKIVAVAVDRQFIRTSYLDLDVSDNFEFVKEFNKIQKRYTQLNEGQDIQFVTRAYSEQQLEVMKSYVPIIAILRQEVVYFSRKIVNNTFDQFFLPDAINESIKLEIEYSLQLVRLSETNWPLIFGEYVCNNHQNQIYFFNIQFLILEILKWLWLANVFSILCLHLFRKDFWYLLVDELNEQGLSLNFSVVYSLIKSNWKLIVFPIDVTIAQEIVQEECLKLKEDRERENIRIKAVELFGEVQELLDIDDSQLGTLKHYYNCATNPKKKLNVAWQNLVILGQQLRNIEMRKQNMSVLLNDEVINVNKGKKKRLKKSNHRSRNLINDLEEMLPSNHQVDLSIWNDNNCRCLSRALIILEKMHPEAVSRLLNKRDLKNLMMMRNPFMKAIEVRNKKIIFKCLGITVKRKNKKTSKEIEVLQLPKGLRVIVIGVGQAVKKKKDFKKAIVDLGADFGGFIYADNLRKVQSAAQLAKNGSALIVLTTRHLSHKASGEMKNVSNVVQVQSLSIERFKEELVKGYNSLK